MTIVLQKMYIKFKFGLNFGKKDQITTIKSAVVDPNKFREKLKSFVNEIKTSSEEIIKLLSE